MKLYTRDEIIEIKGLVKELMETLHQIMKDNIDAFMPGFTHLQKAQPVTLAHHTGAYMEMFKRDYSRLCDIYERMNYCRWDPAPLPERRIRWTGSRLQNFLAFMVRL